MIIAHLDQNQAFRQRLDLVIDQFSVSAGENGMEEELVPCAPSGNFAEYQSLMESNREIKFLGTSELDEVLGGEWNPYRAGGSSPDRTIEEFNARQRATFNDDGIFLLCGSKTLLNFSSFFLRANPEPPGKMIMTNEDEEFWDKEAFSGEIATFQS